MNTQSDIALIREVADGSEEALRLLIDRYRERLYRLAVGLLDDHAAAADAVQETFIRLWQRARRFDQRYQPATWLCTVCARRCYDELRRRRRHREAVAEMEVEAVQPETMQADELLQLLRQAVACLPPKQRVVYQLREIECLDAEATAETLRMTVDQVKANLWNARNAVREKLKQYGI